MAMTMVGPRRRAREIALQILIQLDVNPELDVERGIRLYFDHLAVDAGSDDGDDDGPMARGKGSGSLAGPAFDRSMVDELVRGVAKARAQLDEIVQNLSRNWRLERMALVERNVIRLALYELKYVSEVPTNVALDEAIELTKRYGTAEGAAFVNGLLDRAVTEQGLRR
ncbi:MAG TPA: transcription antitermination factor NusB [Polyangia bacterium]|nr:transcription antitermination factor NusB [Polyangia bacterium]